MKQKHQQTLKSLYLQGFRQKNRTLKIVSFSVSYGGCGGRTEIAHSLRNSPPDCFSQICCSLHSPNLEPPRRHMFHIAPNHFCLCVRQK